MNKNQWWRKKNEVIFNMNFKKEKKKGKQARAWQSEMVGTGANRVILTNLPRSIAIQLQSCGNAGPISPNLLKFYQKLEIWLFIWNVLIIKTRISQTNCDLWLDTAFIPPTCHCCSGSRALRTRPYIIIYLYVSNIKHRGGTRVIWLIK